VSAPFSLLEPEMSAAGALPLLAIPYF
jgi:hypothetical protein